HRDLLVVAEPARSRTVDRTARADVSQRQHVGVRPVTGADAAGPLPVAGGRELVGQRAEAVGVPEVVHHPPHVGVGVLADRGAALVVAACDAVYVEFAIGWLAVTDLRGTPRMM